MGKMAGSSKMSSDDDDELWNTPSLISIVATLSRLKRKVLCNRLGEVSDKIRSNSAKLRKYTNGLFESAKQWGDRSLPGSDKLAFRSQKVLCNFTNPDSDSKDDGHSVAPPIIFGSSSGGKTAVRPSKLPAHPNVPPYTTWIYLDRNQRMTEDQSVQGRRRIYYDPVGNETLIASDSEEEEPEEEEPRHAFSKGEDYIIWTAVQERGASGLLFEQIAQCIHVTREEVQARYEMLLKDVDKQAKCEAHGEGTRTTVPSPGGRRKGTRDVGRLTYKETKSGPKEYLKTAGKGTTRKLEDEKIEPKDLVAAMDSFDNLFCRRCLVFDCRLHGCSQPLVHPSERQSPMNTDSEPTLPCGPHCYLLSQPARVGAPALCLPGVAESRAGDLVPPSGEGAEVARLAKRQKDGETSSGSEKLHPQFDRTSTLCVDASFVGKLENLSVNGKDKDITLGPIAETTHLRSSNEESPSLKREPPSIASRLTSHKKLARSTARRVIEQNGRRGGETQHRLKEVIDLTDVDMEFSPENGIGSPKRLAGEMTGNAMDGMTGSEQIQSKHDEELMLNQEKTRFSPTKKLARSTKRALEENMQSPVKLEDQVELDSEIQDAPMVKRLALTTQNGRQEKVSSAVSSPPRSADGLKMDICQTGSDLFKEKGKGTSPKKLARSARKPIVGKLPGRVEGHELQSLGNLLVPSPEAEKPVKDESVRNSAARKLARSARKVFAEKVAVAIQQQQLQSHLDIVDKGRGEREHCKEESCDTGGTPTSPVAAIGNAIVPYARGEKSQAHLANPAKTYAVDSTQFTNKNGLILADDREETKRDQTSARLTEVGAVMKTAVPKSEDAHKRAEFKDDWTPLEKGLYEKGMQIFGKSSCMIANNMLKGCKTCAEVRDYLLTQEAAAKRGVDGGLHQFPDSLACVLKWDVARARARFYGRRKGSRKLKFTLKSAGNAIRKRMVNGKDAPQRQYTPCGCLFTCGKQCPCQLSGTCCEKYCGCAKTCKNRFRGCHCAKSQCCSRQCPCFAASRECDPDVCRNCWTGCGDGKVSGPPPREDKDNYQCHNMKLLLKQQQRVLLSRSDVAGWGAFLKDTVSKHEYLGEYTGELISHREADKRGKIYDRENSSFLFNLNDQYVLDACRKGDKLKFANHSPNPNCYAKIMLVAGDHRVGIFANKMILAGEELFYDYRYEAERAPSWARRGDDSGSGKKDDTGPSERRSKQAS